MMRLVTWKAVKRMGIALAILAGLVVGAALYMFRCDCNGRVASQVRTVAASDVRRHVEMLATTIGDRNVQAPAGLAAAADYIERTWREQGYDVRRYGFKAYDVTCDNIEVTLTGATRPREIILLGAHYDSVFENPAANDNGSGVAALLELSRVLAGAKLDRTVRFVAFVNEEPPFFQQPLMGSRVYARMAKERGDDIKGVLVLETMGYYSDEPGSQKYPPFFNWFYPSKGNFIGFISNLESRSFLHEAVGAFRANSGFPSECCATFGSVPGVDWSDHWSFWQEGWPAVMVSDTAIFRYPYYHHSEDTPDKLDYGKLARVTTGLAGAVETLAME